MSLFLETLIQDGVITNEQALSALLAQIERAPALAKIVSDLKLMSAGDLTQVLIEQAKGQWNFQAAAEKIGVWSESIAQSISNELYKRSAPVTQILIEQGAMTASMLNESYDRIKGEIPALPQDFSNELLVHMKSRAQALTHHSSKQQLEELFHDFHHLKGIAVFQNLNQLKIMSEKYENILSILIRDPAHEYHTRIQNLVLAGVHVIPLLFDEPLSEMTQAKASRLDTVLNKLLEAQTKTG